MKGYHNSREIEYRNPFGAINVGSTVYIRMDLWDNAGAKVSLRTWIDGAGEKLYEMEPEEKDEYVSFSVKITPDDVGIVWYSFLITRADNTTMWYGTKENTTGGEGQLYFVNPPSFQLTVSRERKVPDWYKKGIAYQIFPDRFCRGEGFEERVEEALKMQKNGPAKRFVEDWDTPVSYEKTPEGRISTWDFYGGNLEGIKEKLPYLEDLGITVLYINPIFEAASNHRYDTGDYMKLDAMLGKEGDFEEFCKEAKKHGISVILDGVFSHTGCDSRYFNKYGNYDTLGAFQSEDSEYREWYRFGEDGKYDCWWGVDDLPNVEEMTESYRKFIYENKDSVIRKWLRAGAKGWRLDVADELPDEFIKGIKESMISELGDESVLLGEVWEDASNKISYGVLRKYLLGDELDAVMNYPFRDSAQRFVLGKIDAVSMYESMMSLYENYPRENFYSSLNLIGSHDRIRAITYMGEAPDATEMSDEEKRNFRLTDDKLGMAKGRMWMLALMQMTMPGVPCIYYGDEAGMQGYEDPYNRGTYPWGSEDKDLMTIYHNTIGLRKLFPIFTDGSFEPFYDGTEVFGYTRELDGEYAVVLFNNSKCNSNKVELPAYGGVASELISGRTLEYEEDKVIVSLYPSDAAIVYFGKEKPLGKKMEKGNGILCHITSLPNKNGPGNIYEPAYKFIDYLADMKQKYWQILPVNPTDAHGSPYAGASAFAGNISLLGKTVDELEKEFEDWKENGDEIAYRAFVKENDDWLKPYAMYMAVKEKNENVALQHFPEGYRRYDEKMYNDKALKERAEFHMYCQYVFETAWHKVREYAADKGISIIGDMPMFVSADSADVWAEPKYFSVDEEGYIKEQAGVPPDYFAKDGQLWGNPVYNWEELEACGYDWWMRRLKRAFGLYDYVRLDHFRGFEAYWSVPERCTAVKGKWKYGPGRKLFEKAYSIFGPLPVLAEDLGLITPGVRGLVAGCGVLGTDVMQFSDYDPMDGYNPPEHKVVYSGTHDNQTLIGWCKDRYPDKEPEECAEKLLENLYECDADVKIVPLQDILGLDDEARMNVPGTTGKNWSWQAKELV